MKLLLKGLLVLALTLASLICNLPNYIQKPWLPDSKINLGLDLQGGSHLLLNVEIENYIDDQLLHLTNNLKKTFRNEKIGYKNFIVNKQKLSFQPRDLSQVAQIEKLVQQIDKNLLFSLENDKIVLSFSDYKIIDLQDKVIEQSIEIIRMRVDGQGTKEPIIHRQGNRDILLQVPGANDPEEIKSILGKTAKLSFHLVDDTIDISKALQFGVKSGQMLVQSKEQDGIYCAIYKQAELTGDMLIDAQAIFQNARPAISFELNNLGSRIFAEVTRNNVGKRLAIVLDGKLLSAPSINESISGGKGVISGNYTAASAGELALLLRAGALPAPLNVIEERNVGPNLGADSIAGGKKAALFGMGGVVIFMLWSYGIFGVFANIALIAGVSYILTIIGLIGATLTLPGIAGIILTIGMAVDANILIYERIREEAKKGNSKGHAIKIGFESAFTTIADSNITTLIAAFLLYIFGSGVIKGFAVTLSIGILASMFSAIVVTKLFIDLWLKYSHKTANMVF